MTPEGNTIGQTVPPARDFIEKGAPWEEVRRRIREVPGGPARVPVVRLADDRQEAAGDLEGSKARSAPWNVSWIPSVANSRDYTCGS